MATVANQAQLESEYIAQEQAMALHTIRVVKALVSNALGLHEVDFTALAAKVTSINTLLDGDETTEGYQAFAALSLKLSTVEATANNNAQAITALQSALNSQIATLTARVDTVETEARTGREALALQISALATQYENHVAAYLLNKTEQDNKLADHEARVAALESSKVLIEARVAALETDNTANKSAITQIQNSLSVQADALAAELARAQSAETALRAELATERARIDSLATASNSYATFQNVNDAGVAGATAFCNKLWAEAGVPMPSGLAMPNGSTSP